MNSSTGKPPRKWRKINLSIRTEVHPQNTGNGILPLPTRPSTLFPGYQALVLPPVRTNNTGRSLF